MYRVLVVTSGLQENLPLVISITKRGALISSLQKITSKEDTVILFDIFVTGTLNYWKKQQVLSVLAKNVSIKNVNDCNHHITGGYILLRS